MANDGTCFGNEKILLGNSDDRRIRMWQNLARDHSENDDSRGEICEREKRLQSFGKYTALVYRKIMERRYLAEN